MNRAVEVSILLALAAATVSAQHWELEQVDTIGGMGAGLHMRRDPDGRLCLAYYHESTKAIRWAHRDGVWLFEDPDIPAVAAEPDENGFSFALGPGGQVGLAYQVDAEGIVYAQRRDSVWEYELVGDDTGARRFRYSPRLGFDTSGVPNVLFGEWSLMHAVRLESAWVLAVAAPGGGDWNRVYTPQQLATDRGNRLHAFSLLCWNWPAPTMTVFGADIILSMHAETAGWTHRRLAGNAGFDFSAMTMALPPDDEPAVCYMQTGDPTGFFYNDIMLEPHVTNARLAVDSLARPHIAYVNGAFLYRYLDNGRWHVSTILEDRPVFAGDVVFDSLGQPLVAYHLPDRGVWLARGIGIVGVEDVPRDDILAIVPNPTIIRGVLDRAGLGHGPALLDISGRKVMDLQSGENDVRHLAPGVYFIRTEGPRGQGVEGSSRKVVIQR
jgi:hypothetical protein